MSDEKCAKYFVIHFSKLQSSQQLLNNKNQTQKEKKDERHPTLILSNFGRNRPLVKHLYRVFSE